MLIGAVGWLYRDQLLALLPTTDHSPAPAYHLQVEPERLDEEKLSQALQQAGISPPSASTSAQSSDSATPAYVAEYANTTDQELHERLEAGIAALDNTEPYVGVLAAYKAKINQLESTNPTKARQALMEAVQLSKEFTALYLYAKE